MKRMSENWRVRYAIVCLLVFVGLGSTLPSYSQSNQKVKISGTVYEYDANNKRVPLGFATVSIPDAALGTTSNDRGKYELDGITAGKVRLSIQYLGKVSIDTLVNATRDLTLNFTLKNEDFRLKEVTVTATNSRSGKSTASHISRSAMDHMQATSLYDLMALMPGGISENQDMSSAQQINIRQLSSSVGPESPMNALGTAVIRDGAPISNNANMSAMSASVLGSSDQVPGALGGGASPAGGTDVRSISTENIESVQIIRGIPSVEYGDLTSGAVIINTKAGREPLRVKAKANPHIYQVSMGTGFDLGEKKGALNVSADYAYNTTKPTASYDTYQRATAKVLYSNTFFNNKLRSNTSLDFIYGLDQRKLNPDDEQTKTRSEGQDVGFTLNTNGTWNINKGWLKTIKYVLSGTYTDKQSFYETLVQYGATAVMDEGDKGQPIGTNFSNLRTYLGSKLSQNSGINLSDEDAAAYYEELTSAFFNQYFGPASTYLRAVFEKQKERQQYMYNNWAIDGGIYEKAYIDTGYHATLNGAWANGITPTNEIGNNRFGTYSSWTFHYSASNNNYGSRLAFTYGYSKDDFKGMLNNLYAGIDAINNDSTLSVARKTELVSRVELEMVGVIYQFMFIYEDEFAVGNKSYSSHLDASDLEALRVKTVEEGMRLFVNLCNKFDFDSINYASLRSLVTLWGIQDGVLEDTEEWN